MKKQITAFLLITFAFVSCWNLEKDTPPRVLPDGVYKEETVVTKYDTGYRLVKAFVDPVTGKFVAQHYVKDSIQPVAWANVPIKEVEVVPNGEQTMKYSYFTGYGWKQFVALILIAILFYLLYNLHIANDQKDLQRARLMLGKAALPIEVYTRGSALGIIRGCMVLLIVALAFGTLQPADVARNNAKTITVKQLEHYQSIDHELNYFWDSVFNKGALLYANNKK